jgi:hypothetical protein
VSGVALGSVIFLAAIIGLIGWLFSRQANVALATIVVSFVILASAAMAIATVLLSPTIQARLMRAVALARLRFFEAAAAAFGTEKDGRPIRATALAIFIVGSIADLVGSWASA